MSNDCYYTWFYYNNNCNDKIGIDQTGLYMLHDNILYQLKEYQRITKNNSLYLVYTIVNKGNFVLHEHKTAFYYKFNLTNGKYVFDLIGFNGKEYE